MSDDKPEKQTIEFADLVHSARIPELIDAGSRGKLLQVWNSVITLNLANFDTYYR